MKIAIGSDQRTHLTDVVVSKINAMGYETELFGPLSNHKMNWTDVARQVGESVIAGTTDEGILFCWTGMGVSMAANKVPGVRAALCDDAETARGARLWNNANVLCLSIRRVSEVMAAEILDAWFTHEYVPNPEDDACLAKLASMEAVYSA